MLLALRGWTPAAFREASPQFLDLARYALMVQTMLPIYQEAQATLGVELGGMEPTQKIAFAKAKIAAASAISYLEPVLLPGDD